MWQDYLIVAGGFIFSLALIPSIRGKNKPEVSTSAMTATLLYAYCYAYATLDLWLAFSSGILTATTWATLALQKALQKH